MRGMSLTSSSRSNSVAGIRALGSEEEGTVSSESRGRGGAGLRGDGLVGRTGRPGCSVGRAISGRSESASLTGECALWLGWRVRGGALGTPGDPELQRSQSPPLFSLGP